MQDAINFPKKWMIFIALMQGLALLLLHQSIDLEFWPYPHMEWLYALYAISFVVPVMLLLALTDERQPLLFKMVLPFGLLLGVLGFYIGKQTLGSQYWAYHEFLAIFVLTIALAVFKALMYMQQYVSGKPFGYSSLFRWSWRNFLTIGLSVLFAGAVWALLMLWAGLFKAINITFFFDLFTNKWFYYPALALAHGFGVIVFRHLSQVIDVITRLQQALMKYLLILIVFISIIFMASLPFSGLQVLWKSGGSTLILWMQALMLFFVNAVYQNDSHERPYPQWLHRFIFVGVALLPVYSIISLYGLSLRVDQYGLSISRAWGLLIWFLLCVFSVGYFYGIIKYRDNWLMVLNKINISGGLLVLVAMLLINSPLLDFRKMTVSSQLALLRSHKVTVEKFDVDYFNYHLGRPGREALEFLQKEYASVNPVFVRRIKSALDNTGHEKDKYTKDDFLMVTKPTNVPDEVIEAVYQYTKSNYWAIRNVTASYLLPVDANKDGVPEYLYVRQLNGHLTLQLFYLAKGKWLNMSVGTEDYRAGQVDDSVDKVLNSGDIEVVEPEWKDLKIGHTVYRIR